MTEDRLRLYELRLRNRLLLGTARYPSPQAIVESVERGDCEMITLSLRRQNPGGGGGRRMWNLLRDLNRHLLPNTAGCHSAREAVTLAKMSRDLFETSRVKLEVIADDYSLRPEPGQLLLAAETLLADGFEVYPYCTEDLDCCLRLYEAGCRVLMPWAAPIGSGQGVIAPEALAALRRRLPEAALIVDAGLGAPSHAAQVMEMGFDGVLLNTAVALADDPPAMAESFSAAVAAGRRAYLAGLMQPRSSPEASTPVVGRPFWHEARRIGE